LQRVHTLVVRNVANGSVGYCCIGVHPSLIKRFSRLGLLYERSKTLSADNYFGIYDTPQLFESTERQFKEWERLLQKLDPVSFDVFLRKTSGRVAAHNPDRGWTQLVESMNEVRGYQHARAIGYENCRLLDEQSHPFPDVEASNAVGKWCLLEVKTIQESAEELRLRGEVQAAEPGLPLRLTRVLRRRYLHACRQIAGHARASEAERICFMIINLDLRTVLAQENKRLLDDFLRTIEADVKIQSISQHWPAGV
jgi:hypothetical protein